MNNYIILTESDRTDDVTDKKDLEFLIQHKLIEIKSGSIISRFVGEVKTPHNNYFSLPKNFNDVNKISIIKDILDEYRKLLYKTRMKRFGFFK